MLLARAFSRLRIALTLSLVFASGTASSSELRVLYVPSDPAMAEVQKGFFNLVLNHSADQGKNVYSAAAQVVKIVAGESAEQTIQQLVARVRSLDPASQNEIGVRRLYNSQETIVGAIDVAAYHIRGVSPDALNAFKLLTVQRLGGRPMYFFFQGVERTRNSESTFMAVLDRDHRELLVMGSVER